MCMNIFSFTPMFEKIVRKVKLSIISFSYLETYKSIQIAVFFDQLVKESKNTKNEMHSRAFKSTWSL